MTPADPSLPFCISQLPDELLLEIIGCLKLIRGFKASLADEQDRQAENTKRVQTLHSLTLSCWRLHAVSQSILYDSFIQPAKDPRITSSFLTTIIAKRSLTKYIHYFECLIDLEGFSFNQMRSVPSLWERNVREMKSAEWQPRFHDGSNNLQARFMSLLSIYELRDQFQSDIAVILALCPNLAEVTLLGSHTLAFATLSLRKYNNSGALRNVWIRASPPSGPYLGHRDDFADFFLGPTIPISGRLWLSNIELNNWFAVSFPENRNWYSHELLPNIEEIAIDMCEIAPYYLDQMLFSHSQLKRFVCRWGIRSDRVASHESQEIDLPRLGHALSHHKDTLETLVIDTLESAWMVSMDQNIPAIGSLRPFTALKTLDVSGLVLWGDYAYEEYDSQPIKLGTILPEHLENLIIWTEWEECVEESLFGLPADCSQLLTHLKSIECQWRPTPKPIATILVEEFAAEGVELQLQMQDE